jgi:hypothetical protein
MKVDKFLISIITFILLLGFATYWQFRNFQKSLSKIVIPKFEIPKFEIKLPTEKRETKEFISPDGKLKLKFSTDWIELSASILEALNKEAVKEGAKILLYAQKMNLEKKAFASLVVQEVEIKEDANLEELIEKLKKENKEKGVEMEIIASEIKGREGIIEAEYKRKEGIIFHSKTKVILEKNKCWLITIFSLKQDWINFKEEANEILNSVEILQ